VYCSTATDGEPSVFAVIGGGASGTLTAIHLLRLAAARRRPVRIALIDRAGRHGPGQAYATAHPGHALNSPATQMSAVAGDPGHLLRWAAAAGIAGDGFLPRHVYGRYLRETLADAELRAQPWGTVRRLTSQVVAIRGSAPGHPLRLRLAADGHVDADVAVLATGNLPAATPFPVPASGRYIADPWAPGALSPAGDGSPVVVLGTGLTMLDVAIAVTDASPQTVVVAVSRHGLLPRVHRQAPPVSASYWLPVFSQNAGAVRLTDLMWQVRAAVGENTTAWQDIVDALRPHVPELWQRLPLPDKRLFLSHVARYWEVHRHRVPPGTARRIAALRATGRLRVLAGRVGAVSETGTGLRPGGGRRRRPRPRGRLAHQRHRARHGHHRNHRPAAARPARPRAGPARSAAARPGRRLLRRAARRGGQAGRQAVRARAAAARVPVRDHRDTGDPRPGRRAGPPARGRPGAGPAGQRGLVCRA
jgi:uncharacterized NAD(P)/FAD-binding protein YdhS